MTALNDNLLYTNDQKKKEKNINLRYQRRQRLKKNIYL